MDTGTGSSRKRKAHTIKVKKLGASIRSFTVIVVNCAVIDKGCLGQKRSVKHKKIREAWNERQQDGESRAVVVRGFHYPLCYLST